MVGKHWVGIYFLTIIYVKYSPNQVLKNLTAIYARNQKSIHTH